MNLGIRVMLTVFIVIAILFALALVGCYTGRWEEDAPPFSWSLASAQSKIEICMDEETKEVVRGIMMESLEVALKQHIVHAFEVWMKDPTGQPGRAKTGVERGVKAFIDARKGVMDWAPPPCTG